MPTSRTTVGGACRVSMPDNESLWRTILGVTQREAEVITALVAAAACGLPGKTIAQIRGLTGHSVSMNRLERQLWVTRVARVDRSTAFVWAATPLAAKRLELTRWEPLLFSDEELTRIDLDAPGFLRPPANEQGERAAS